jgi:uncharacterized membrane protein YsdA (DUF1294 family)
MAYAVSPDYRSPSAFDSSTAGSAIKLTARIVEWDKAKACGTLLFEKHRIAVQRSEFIAMHKRPEVGDTVDFRLGKDAEGTLCAQQVEHHNDGGRIRLVHLAVVAVLLAAPGLAAWKLVGRNDWRLVVGCALGMSAIAFLMYCLDKLRAKHGQWRMAESTLHLVAALGGWPGAYLAQKHFRHKSCKKRFILIFWLIVTVHQFAAFDYLQDWAAMRALNEAFMRHTMPTPKG